MPENSPRVASIIRESDFQLCKFVRQRQQTQRCPAVEATRDRRVRSGNQVVWILPWIDELANLHFRGNDFFIRARLPNHIARYSVNLRESIERHKRDIFHENTAGLVQ